MPEPGVPDAAAPYPAYRLFACATVGAGYQLLL